MPTKQTRAEKKAETKERLLRAAERIVTDHGFGRLTLEAVADRAGLTKGAIYSNFESKEELVVEVAMRLTPGLSLDEVVLEARDLADMLDRVAGALAAMARRHAKEAALLLEFQALRIRDPKLRHAVQARDDADADDIGDRILGWFDAHAEEIPLPLEEFLHVLNAVATGLLTRRLVEGAEAVPDELFTWTFRRLVLGRDD